MMYVYMVLKDILQHTQTAVAASTTTTMRSRSVSYSRIQVVVGETLENRLDQRNSFCGSSPRRNEATSTAYVETTTSVWS